MHFGDRIRFGVAQARQILVLAFVVGGLAGCQSIVLHFAEPHFLKTGPNGPDTPQTFGAPYEHVSIPSGTRILDGYLVRAPDECSNHSAVLIFHGVMETISEWSAAQAFLRENCVASLVFDFTGHGNSSHGGTVKRVNHDALAAYRYFSTAFGSDQRLCILGHSMGNGPMLEELPAFTAAPSCVVVASPLSSLRDWGVAHVSRLMAYMIPDVWNCVANISRNTVPVLVIHSRSDSVNQIEMGLRVFAAAREPKRMIEVDGFRHNAIYKTPSLIWWSPVLAFIQQGGS
jgi:alpha-beta hydrolase superfamily lysophospholipase